MARWGADSISGYQLSQWTAVDDLDPRCRTAVGLFRLLRRSQGRTRSNPGAYRTAGLRAPDDRRRGVLVDAVRLLDLDLSEAPRISEDRLELGTVRAPAMQPVYAAMSALGGVVHVRVGDHVGDSEAAVQA